MSYTTINLDLSKQKVLIPPLIATRGDHDVPLTVVLTANGENYDLGDQTVTCITQKPDGQIIQDDNEAHYKSNLGGFIYTPPVETYQVAGRMTLGFSFSGGDSSAQFELVVLPRPGEGLSSSYIPEIDKILSAAVEATNGIKSADAETAAFIIKAKEQAEANSEVIAGHVKNAKEAVDQIKADGNTAITKVCEDAGKVITDFVGQTKEALEKLNQDKQAALTDLETKKSAALAAIQSEGKTAGDAAIKAVQEDWNAKKKGIEADWNTQVAALKQTLTDQMQDIQTTMDKAEKEDIPALNDKLDEFRRAVDELNANSALVLTGIKLHDGTDLVKDGGIVKLPDFATKGELSEAGKVKTVNGKQPDADGNIQLVIPEPDLTPFLKADDAKATYLTKAEAKKLPEAIEADLPSLGYIKKTEAQEMDDKAQIEAVDEVKRWATDEGFIRGGKMTPAAYKDAGGVAAMDPDKIYLIVTGGKEWEPKDNNPFDRLLWYNQNGIMVCKDVNQPIKATISKPISELRTGFVMQGALSISNSRMGFSSEGNKVIQEITVFEPYTHQWTDSFGNSFSIGENGKFELRVSKSTVSEKFTMNFQSTTIVSSETINVTINVNVSENEINVSFSKHPEVCLFIACIEEY